MDAAVGATKRKGKIDARARAIRAGPVNSNHAEETGLKEASAGGSVLKGSETKRRRKPRAVLRMANALRGRNGPNVENVPREVLAQTEGSESSVATGLNAMNVRNEASARNGRVVSVQSDPAWRGLDRKAAAKAGAGGGVVDAIVADQIAVVRIGLKARANHGHNRLDNPRWNRRKSSAM